MTKIYIAVETVHDTKVAVQAFTSRELANAAVAYGGEVYEAELDAVTPTFARTVISSLRRRIEEATVERGNVEACIRELNEALRVVQRAGTDDEVDHG